RLSDRAGRRRDERRDDRDGQFPGRHSLRRDRPPHPSGEVTVMSTPADVLTLPPPAPRFAFVRGFRLGNIPMIPTLILVTIAFVALFANQLAPYNPEVGSLAARFKPP